MTAPPCLYMTESLCFEGEGETSWPAGASSWRWGCCVQGGWCLVLPCSRSCWSYHGSSSSVTNSSIFPELSMGDPGRNRRNAPLCENKRAPARQQVAPSSWSPQPGECCAVALYVFPLFLPLSSVLPPSLPLLPLIPPPPSSGPSRCSEPLLLPLLQRSAETWQRCCDDSTSFINVIGSTLTVHLGTARKTQHYRLVPFRQSAPSRFVHLKMSWHHSYTVGPIHRKCTSVNM